MNHSPTISVIIPVYNAKATLARCLQAVFASDFTDFEIILVDDCSSDGSLQAADGFPCTFIRMDRNQGAGAARNRGAEIASGQFLLFVDSDVLVDKDTIRHVVESFGAQPEATALFGSYQRDALPRNFVSDYKNLLHHYTHQNSREDAATFFTACGAVKKDVFLKCGGFDERQRCLEDIELGYRLHSAGCRIYLDKALQVTHCKQYSLMSLVKSDLFCRAIPWTRLMLAKGIFRFDLNTQSHNVLSVIISFLMLGCVPALWIDPIAGGGLYFALVAWFLWLNRKFLFFVCRERGGWFALRATALSWFGYLYSGAGLIMGSILFVKDRLSGAAVKQPGRHSSVQAGSTKAL